MSRNGKMKWFFQTLVPLLLAAVPLLIFSARLLDPLDERAQDSLYQRLSLVSPDIYVVGIDEETLQRLGPFQDWKRDIIAQAIDILNGDPEYAPAVIGVDIGFYGQRTEKEDAWLVQSAKKTGNVVLACYATFGSEIEDNGSTFYSQRVLKTFEEPFEELRAVAPSGFTNVLPDGDGVVRRALYSLEAEGQTRYSFAYEVCRKFYESFSEPPEMPQPPLDHNGQWYIPYSGKPGDFFGAGGEGTSLWRVLNGEIDPAMFAGSVVLIGPYSSGMMDSHYTPVSHREQMNGVEVQANILQALMEENFKRPVPRYWEYLAISLLTAAGLILSRKLDLRFSLASLILLTIVQLAGSSALYDAGWIITVVYPLAGMWLIFLVHIFSRYLAEARERRKILNVFGRYLAPQLVDSIARQDNAMPELGGETRDIAVLFVDIRGFTSMSETLAPSQVVEILNLYLELTTRAVFDNGGTVDKFIGDATMAVFNAPLPLEDYVYRAVKTGLDMVRGAKALEQEIRERFGQTVGFGVGIHCGQAIVGNIGTSFRMDYTAIGDTVNIASRLENQAKAGEVLISGEVARRLKPRIRAQFLGEYQLKGKSEEFPIYQALELEDREPAGSPAGEKSQEGRPPAAGGSLSGGRPKREKGGDSGHSRK